MQMIIENEAAKIVNMLGIEGCCPGFGMAALQ